MSWRWSHSPEAFDQARQNVLAMPEEELAAIIAEYAAHRPWEGGPDGFDQDAYDQSIRETRDIPLDILANQVWELMSAQAICDEGGYHAWCCPFGCHHVSFLEASAGRVAEEVVCG